jgi:hypothetical protein
VLREQVLAKRAQHVGGHEAVLAIDVVEDELG